MTRQTDSKRKRTCRWLRASPQPLEKVPFPDRIHRQQYSILHFSAHPGFSTSGTIIAA